jgi:transcriptional antiterminator NusG
MAKRWYVVHAFSGYEKKVMLSLQERIALQGMEDLFDDVLVPTEEVVEMRAGQKRKSERKFFPGYVLVHMELNDDTWHLVKEHAARYGIYWRYSRSTCADYGKEADKILQRMEAKRRHASAQDCLRAWRNGSSNRRSFQ